MRGEERIERLRSLGPVFRAAEAREAGLSWRDLYELRDAGELITLSRGIYQLAERAGGEAIDFVNESGLGSIGTPDDAIEQIDRLVKQSGGFGCYMTLAHEWANPEATKRSYELIAQNVFPRFQGHDTSTLAAKERARTSREQLAERNMQAVTDMVEKHEAELASKADS